MFYNLEFCLACVLLITHYSAYLSGNDRLHELSQTNNRLSIFMRTWHFQEGYANYSNFVVNAESDYYRLLVSTTDYQ